MSKPRLLDLFCGAGGAAMGYQRAGFEVVGVDIAPQPRYPFEFHQADALLALDRMLACQHAGGYRLRDFDAIHASPPCQDYSLTRHITHKQPVQTYPRLIAPVRTRLEATGLPWIIENVECASPEMPDAIVLCGTMFGLRLQRHRLFSSNVLLYSAGVCRHRAGDVTVRRKRAEYCGIWSGHSYQDRTGRTRPRRSAMGIDWPMTMHELGEAIPPAYTEWLGRQLLAALLGRERRV